MRDLSSWIEGIKAGELPWTVWKKAPRQVESRLVGTPTAATTDDQGQFEIRGIGRERLVELIFEGEAVAHRQAVAVTRAMEPIQQTLITPNPRQPSTNVREPVFGASSRSVRSGTYD